MEKIFKWFETNRSQKIFVLRENKNVSIVKNLILIAKDKDFEIILDLENDSPLILKNQNIIIANSCGENELPLICGFQEDKNYFSINTDSIHLKLISEEEIIFTISEELTEWGDYLFSKRPVVPLPLNKKGSTGWPMRLLEEGNEYVHVASIIGNKEIKKIIEDISYEEFDAIILYAHKDFSLTYSKEEIENYMSKNFYRPFDVFVYVDENEAPSLKLEEKDEFCQIHKINDCYFFENEKEICFICPEYCYTDVFKTVIENPKSRKIFLESGILDTSEKYEDVYKKFKEKLKTDILSRYNSDSKN